MSIDNLVPLNEHHTITNPFPTLEGTGLDFDIDTTDIYLPEPYGLHSSPCSDKKSIVRLNEDGTPNDFRVSTGPLQVVKAKSAGFVATTALFTGGIGIAAKAAGALSDKVKTDSFMKYIDEKIYQNKGNGPELVQSISTESKSEDDIPDKIKKLSDLKDQGILTDEESAAKKKDLLDKM